MPKSDQEPPSTTTNPAPPRPLRNAATLHTLRQQPKSIPRCAEMCYNCTKHHWRHPRMACSLHHPVRWRAPRWAPTRMTCTRLPIRHFSLMRCRPGINISERQGCDYTWAGSTCGALLDRMRSRPRCASTAHQSCRFLATPSRKVEGTWCAQTSALQMGPGRR